MVVSEIRGHEAYDDFFASLYDELVRKSDDLPFLTQLAGEYRDPIAELACGTGRVTLHLARKGYYVHASDLSEAMLRVARKHLELESEEVRARATFARADMAAVRLPKAHFGLVIIPFSAIYHVARADRREEVYRRCRLALKRGGALIIDNSYYQPRGDDFASTVRTSNCGQVILPGGVSVDVELRTEEPRPSMEYSRTFLFRNHLGEVIRSHVIPMTYVPPEATGQELRRAGFAMISLHDGYGGPRVEPHQLAHRQLFIAEA